MEAVRHFGLAVLLVWMGVGPATAAGQTTGSVVTYSASLKNVKYLFATAEPVAHLKPGDVLDTNTLDCFGDAIQKPGDKLSMAPGRTPADRAVFVEGREEVPGYMLAVKILHFEVNL